MLFPLVYILLGVAAWSSPTCINARPVEAGDEQSKQHSDLSVRTVPLPHGAVALDVDKIAAAMEARMELNLHIKLDDTAEFIFHTAIRDTTPIEDTINKFKAKYIRPRAAYQVGDVINPIWKDETISPYIETKPSQEWRWWAAVSAAYAHAVSGKVYVIIPENRPLDKARINGGSHWWSYELPILTAPNGKVIEIYRSDYNSEKKTFSAPKLIWKKGDPQLGTLQDINIEPQVSTGPDVWGSEVRAPFPSVPMPPVRSMLDV